MAGADTVTLMIGAAARIAAASENLAEVDAAAAGAVAVIDAVISTAALTAAMPGAEDLAEVDPKAAAAVAIALAVFGDRRLILADDPTGALDTETGEDILRLLRARCDAGAAGVLVTHEARHAAWADRVVFLRDGVVVDETGADRVDALVDAGATR